MLNFHKVMQLHILGVVGRVGMSFVAIFWENTTREKILKIDQRLPEFWTNV